MLIAGHERAHFCSLVETTFVAVCFEKAVCVQTIEGLFRPAPEEPPSTGAGVCGEVGWVRKGSTLSSEQVLFAVSPGAWEGQGAARRQEAARQSHHLPRFPESLWGPKEAWSAWKARGSFTTMTALVFCAGPPGSAPTALGFANIQRENQV